MMTRLYRSELAERRQIEIFFRALQAPSNLQGAGDMRQRA